MSQQNPGCLGFLAGLFGGARQEPAQGLPYRTKDRFLTKAELSFYGVLRLAVADQMIICPQVPLHAIFYVAPKEKAQAYRNKIDRKIVDFLLCDPQTFQPIMAIELDDASHNREGRQQRDAFVEQVFEAAGLPIIRVPARTAYTLDEVTGYLRDGRDLNTQVAPPVAAAAAQPGKAPICPKCGVPMVPRQSRKDHSRFWGCSNYPRCTQTAPMDQ